MGRKTRVGLFFLVVALATASGCNQLPPQPEAIPPPPEQPALPEPLPLEEFRTELERFELNWWELVDSDWGEHLFLEFTHTEDVTLEVIAPHGHGYPVEPPKLVPHGTNEASFLMTHGAFEGFPPDDGGYYLVVKDLDGNLIEKSLIHDFKGVNLSIKVVSCKKGTVVSIDEHDLMYTFGIEVTNNGDLPAYIWHLWVQRENPEFASWPQVIIMPGESKFMVFRSPLVSDLNNEFSLELILADGGARYLGVFELPVSCDNLTEK